VRFCTPFASLQALPRHAYLQTIFLIRAVELDSITSAAIAASFNRSGVRAASILKAGKLHLRSHEKAHSPLILMLQPHEQLQASLLGQACTHSLVLLLWSYAGRALHPKPLYLGCISSSTTCALKRQ
jgi:hypothetical protein